MERLPDEILEIIFHYLHQEDKVSCMVVCQSWNRIIENLVFFKTLWIRSREQLDKVMLRMFLETETNDKVERLVIEFYDPKRSDTNVLPSLFPNLREITLHLKLPNKNPQSTERRLFRPWKNTIRVINSLGDPFLAYQILSGDICPLLTEISIGNTNRNGTEELIEILVNAPNLKILTLWNYNFVIMNLEQLHMNVPLLESLSVNGCKIDSAIFPRHIEPVTFIKKLSLTFLSAMEAEHFVNFENYLAKKYPCISDLVIDFPLLRCDGIEMEWCMNRGFTFQIQHIGSHLTTLGYSNKDASQFVFPILDRYGCKVKRANIKAAATTSDFQYILQSNQAQYIQSLSCTIRSFSTLEHGFNKLTALTELQLTLYVGKQCIDFAYMMYLIGRNLEALDLSVANLSVNPDLAPFCPKLKKLKLTRIKLPYNIDRFICSVFPNLRDFTMDMCALSSSTFDMHELKLSNLEIRMSSPSMNDYILVKTATDFKRRWYTVKKISHRSLHPTNNRNIFPSVRYIPFEAYNGTPYMEFRLGLLYDISLVNLL